MKKKLIATGALVLAVSGTAYAAAGGANASGDQKNAQGRSTAAARAASPSVIACDGGRHLSMKSRIVNSPFTFSETATPDEDRALPGGSLTVTGPTSGKDTVLVTVSGETQITGGTATDWMGLEVKLDGVNINPFTAAGDVLAFTGEPSWNLNSGQFCAKVGPGRHTVRVYVNLHDDGANSTLGGWVDDYLVSFQRYA
ncbi:hypothetical protein EKO23_02420 [Nocardioides guangzhouensis]|uniref:CBM6 domain-containing protein n=1 Tax=Nocardioides guangzhouensis TaxID=2497878 RepID=A0A4Q4ZK92_9ACTN|nr:hypothetical protein [Nocardioides guangzhouensis]RYP88753.1 hypothetical protein EKO23_02420 [Nocardioides guangzhouensis]